MTRTRRSHDRLHGKAAVLPGQPGPVALDTDLSADFVLLDGGFAGLSAPLRLRQLNPGVRVDTGLGSNRIVTHTCATFEPGMELSDATLRRTARVHRYKFDQRFPQLKRAKMDST